MKETTINQHGYNILKAKGFDLRCHRSKCLAPLKVGDRIISIVSNQGTKVKYFHKKCYLAMQI